MDENEDHPDERADQKDDCAPGPWLGDPCARTPRERNAEEKSSPSGTDQEEQDQDPQLSTASRVMLVPGPCGQFLCGAPTFRRSRVDAGFHFHLIPPLQQSNRICLFMLLVLAGR